MDSLTLELSYQILLLQTGALRAMPALAKKWTEADLLALPKEDGKYELVDGELVLMPPAGYEHGGYAYNIGGALHHHVRLKRLGRIVDGQTGFWMKSGNLRSPDVSFISKERERQLVRDKKGFFNGAPNLAIEVFSPTERASQIRGKIKDYFETGTEMVCVVYPKTKTIHVYRNENDSIVLKMGDTLDCADIVPGFSMKLTDIFEWEI
jgi:Uma2 family endonuclease